MLFIDTIAIYSWDTCTTDMLVTIHKEQLEKGKSNITNAKGKESNYANTLHYMHEN
jgi:hypothetical protein